MTGENNKNLFWIFLVRKKAMIGPVNNAINNVEIVEKDTAKPCSTGFANSHQ